MQAIFNWEEVTILIHVLQTKGISYLVGDGMSVGQAEETMNPVQLIQRLAACNYPLVENASISLFILHPELAPSVAEALERSERHIAENIAVVTLATLYLQQWWLFRLTFALGHLPRFPETPFVSVWQERHLPPPSSGYGQHVLLALQEFQQERYGVSLNFLDDWQNQINHLLAQEEAYHRQLPGDLKNALVQLSV